MPLAPIVLDTAYCNNASSDTIRTKALNGNSLIWYGTNATGGTGSNLGIKPSTTAVGTFSYYVSQITTATGCESPRAKIGVTINAIPNAPVLSRDTDNFLISGSYGTSWYKDGVLLPDTSSKYKPASQGAYTAKTTLNGCTSAMGVSYYFLVTDVINLGSNEFIKLSPNPFINQLNFDFAIKGYQRLNLAVYSLGTGIKVASMQNLTPGMPIYLGQLSAGTYIINVSTSDNKITHQFKMMKL